MTTGTANEMSRYELNAWDATVQRLNDQSEGGARKLTRRATAPVARKAGEVWERTPGHTTAEEQLRRALEGLTTVTLQPAMNSVNLQRVCRRLDVGLLSEVRALDLERVDQAVPRTRTTYAVGALLQGGATAAAVTAPRCRPP